MKKMLITILVLLIIFIGMVIYRNSEKEAEVKVDEINQIEKYLEKIYCWKEVTNQALPEFNDINNADEKWIWGTLRENINENEIEYETIENTEKELFGKNYTKEYPKEGTEFITYDENSGKYKIKEINLDAIKDAFLINKIEKNQD